MNTIYIYIYFWTLHCIKALGEFSTRVVATSLPKVTEKDTTISNMVTDEDVGRFPVSIMDMGKKPNTCRKKLGIV